MKLLFVAALLAMIGCQMVMGQVATIKLEEINIASIKDLIRKGAMCQDIIEIFMKRIYTINPRINSVITISQTAVQEAMSLDIEYKMDKKIKNFHCVPVLVKDNIDVLGLPTTGGIQALRNSFPQAQASVVQTLVEQGAIVLGKTNLAELASGSEKSETGGQCVNPFDKTRTCGPSSTGSGASLSSLMGVLALGTDTDGSVMNPSAYNYIYGLRSPQGVLSTDGVIPAFAKQDVIGPMARYIDDLALAYYAMAGDSAKFSEYANPTIKRPNELKVGVITNFINNFEVQLPTGKLSYVIDDVIKQAFTNTTTNLKSIGIQIVEQTLTPAQMDEFKLKASAVAVQRLLGCEAKCLKNDMNKYFSATFRFASDAPFHSADDLFKSSLVSSYWQQVFTAANLKAETMQTECAQACEGYDTAKAALAAFASSWFTNVDVVLLPTTGVLPYQSGVPSTEAVIGPNLIAPSTGLATLSIPAAFSKPTTTAPQGYPIGMMFLAPKDKLLSAFKIAKYYETAYYKPKLPKSTGIINGLWYRADETSTSFMRIFDNNLQLFAVV